MMLLRLTLILAALERHEWGEFNAVRTRMVEMEAHFASLDNWVNRLIFYLREKFARNLFMVCSVCVRYTHLGVLQHIGL
jgi:hypothetical protein